MLVFKLTAIFQEEAVGLQEEAAAGLQEEAEAAAAGKAEAVEAAGGKSHQSLIFPIFQFHVYYPKMLHNCT